jgi:pimeloyl-ACP methyl ester carboxylesterase
MRLACGRRFSYSTYGPADGHPVIALHGTPGSHLKFRGATEAARVHGVKLIALDRWGYGDTDAPSKPSLAGLAADVGEIADLLKLDRFAVLGISGGGPYAAAVAATLRYRVTASALVSPVGPTEGVRPRPKLGSYHHVAFRILPKVPGVLPSAFGLLRQVALWSPTLATRIAAGRARGTDRAIASDTDFALSLGHTFAEGLKHSARGPVIDMTLFSQPWRLNLAATTAPTHVWIGDQDRNVPLAAVETLAKAFAGAPAAPAFTRLSEHGHFWIARNFPTALGWIASANR